LLLVFDNEIATEATAPPHLSPGTLMRSMRNAYIYLGGKIKETMNRSRLYAG
jgi:hypothetical protein